MKALDIKLWRELWAMRLQAIAIAMVIVSGAGIYVMSLSTMDSLLETRESYYRNNNFADVFASLKRAPNSLIERIRDIPGVDKAETRVAGVITIDVENFNEPITGHQVSVPDNGASLMNQIYLRRGRMFDAGAGNEVIVSENFANAHRLQPGDEVKATINGKRKKLRIVGIALSPEYIYQIAPGAMFPDPMRYGVLWMARTPMASAFDMEGGFNDVVLTLSADAHVEDVIDRLDDLLEPYGGRGAYGRIDQFSNRFLTEEMKQQRTMATIFPIIFFSVAAFLLNVVINRLISLQREQIAILKAFGYSNMDVGIHYIKLVLMITLIGATAGVLLGIWMGRGLGNIYMDFFSFPFLVFVLKPYVISSALLISLVVAAAGTIMAVRKAVILPPAQAMQPEQPVLYRATFIERLGLQRFFSQPTRMIARHIERQPVKSLLTVIGIGFACGIMMIGDFQQGAIDYMVDTEYNMSQREDLTVNFVEPVSREALYSLSNIEGIEHVEASRVVPVKLRFQHRQYRTSVQGVEPGGDLQRLLDTRLQPIHLPEEGVILDEHLASLLAIRPGQMLTVEVLEGSRPVRAVPVAGLSKQYLGVSAYMQRSALNRLMAEGDVISTAYLSVDKDLQSSVYAELKDMPRVAGVVIHKISIESFYETLAEMVLFYAFVSTLLGGSIAFGVVYNTMRIALSERGRELASLRVLGFTHGEVAYILLGELAALTLMAIPLGFFIGYQLCHYIVVQFTNDLYRIPLVLETSTYAFAASVVIASAFISGVMIWRNIGHLDMVAVLKTRE